MQIAKTKNVKTPQRSGRAAGIDFFIPEDFEKQFVSPGNHILVDLGIKVNIPAGFCLIAFNKSSIATKGLTVGACVIDEDYQGVIHLHLFNVSENAVEIQPGQKIIQFLLMPVSHETFELVSEQDIHPKETTRGTGGFGSTGN